MDYFTIAVDLAREEQADVLERAALKWLARVEQHWRARAEREEQFRRWAAKETNKAVWGQHD